MLNIIPVGKKLQLDIEKPTAGGLDLSSKETVVEYGTVIGMSSECENYKELEIGTRLMFKAWAVDIININKDKFYFIDADSSGICAIYKE